MAAGGLRTAKRAARRLHDLKHLTKAGPNMTMPDTASGAERVLSVSHLSKYFKRLRGGIVTAVNDVSLDIAAGEMVVILGPSGCGKTSMLRSIAGLERPDKGRITSAGRVVYSSEDGVRLPPERRGFGMMFQSYAVWPHMSVFGNVSYPLRIKRVPKAEIEERVDRILGIVGIGHLRDEYPTQLSGGQQQRVALARCLVADPQVILFDEPLSNVDAKVRDELRIELRAMQRRIGFAGIFVTHDQEEATAIADRIVVMRDGDFVQVGSPREVYAKPANRFVAGFLGVINEWTGTLSGADSIDTALGTLVVPSDAVPKGTAQGESITVAVRPEAIAVTTERPAGTGTVWEGSAEDEVFRGAYVDRFVSVNGVRVRSRGDSLRTISEGERVFVRIPESEVRVIAHGSEESADEKGADDA